MLVGIDWQAEGGKRRRRRRSKAGHNAKKIRTHVNVGNNIMWGTT